MILTTESIDISGYTNVCISIDVSETGTMEPDDGIWTYYRINGGSETSIDSSTDDFTSATHTANNIGGTGTGLMIVVKADCDAGTESIEFDNIVVTGTVAAVTGDIWINPMSAATPMGTYTLGDTMGSWNVNFEIGQSSWATSRVGIGTSTAGTGYNWGTAAWYEDGTSSNKRVRRDLSGYTYAATGKHYVICQAVGTAGNTYASKSGNGFEYVGTYPPASPSSAYFTCIAITNPSSQAAITNSANPVTQIDLSWSKNGDGNNVLVLRKTSSDSWTDPTQGSSYTSTAGPWGTAPWSTKAAPPASPTPVSPAA